LVTLSQKRYGERPSSTHSDDNKKITNYNATIGKRAEMCIDENCQEEIVNKYRVATINVNHRGVIAL
jgi:hypothetical protein